MGRVARLVVATPTGRVAVELGGRTTVGRHPENGVRLLHPHVAKHDFAIEARNAHFAVVEVRSLNGVRVGGVRVDGGRPLVDGDELAIGDLRACFEDGVPAEVSAAGVQIDAREPAYTLAALPPTAAGDEPVLLADLAAPGPLARLLRGASSVPGHVGRERLEELFPVLAARIPATARTSRQHQGGCAIDALTTVDDETTLGWVLAGGGTSGAPGPEVAFVAAIRARQTEEILILITAGVRRFTFLEKCTSPWTDPLPTARAALDEAFARWDRGEAVRYVHGFLDP